jgi:hypothetical protein
VSETVSKARVWLLVLVAAALVIDGPETPLRLPRTASRRRWHWVRLLWRSSSPA